MVLVLDAHEFFEPFVVEVQRPEWLFLIMVRLAPEQFEEIVVIASQLVLHLFLLAC